MIELRSSIQSLLERDTQLEKNASQYKLVKALEKSVTDSKSKKLFSERRKRKNEEFSWISYNWIKEILEAY